MIPDPNTTELGWDLTNEKQEKVKLNQINVLNLEELERNNDTLFSCNKNQFINLK